MAALSRLVFLFPGACPCSPADCTGALLSGVVELAGWMDRGEGVPGAVWVGGRTGDGRCGEKGRGLGVSGLFGHGVCMSHAYLLLCGVLDNFNLHNADEQERMCSRAPSHHVCKAPLPNRLVSPGYHCKRNTCASSLPLQDLHINVDVRLDGRNTRLPPIEDMDKTFVTGADAPLAIGTPVKLPDGRALTQHLNSLVRCDRLVGITDPPVVQQILCLLALDLASARARARGRRGVGGGATFADVACYMGWQGLGGWVASVGFLKALQVPEEDFALLVACHQDGMAAHLVEDVEAHVEDVGLGQLKLEQTLEAPAPC
jgi:hypothetical protein